MFQGKGDVLYPTCDVILSYSIVEEKAFEKLTHKVGISISSLTRIRLL